MSGGHQLQLAALWPWLLMATLQAGVGPTGLVLAAAVESERSAEQRAIIRVIPMKKDPTGKLNLTLEGVFAGVAEITPAEGKLMQGSLSWRLSGRIPYFYQTTCPGRDNGIKSQVLLTAPAL
ncbi:hypothetical protein MC885_013251 [Smutsia gigantea]|nr:hypothetical protein MC885_013251 [Smutsia gigantea]